MLRAIGLAIALAIAAGSVSISAPAAAEGTAHKYKYRHHKHPQVRGYVSRRGGYSYSYSDTINTYGDSRNRYGATQSFRDPMLDRQTTAGPFDDGFFFESGIAPRGGNSPYMN
ncbi:MAG: hypothetical protein JSS20_01090 [Proteobacteria bacterium]|nr:hypothetical protein [Pseudomonadota bacterium]